MLEQLHYIRVSPAAINKFMVEVQYDLSMATLTQCPTTF